jgi:hypothetical protein
MNGNGATLEHLSREECLRLVGQVPLGPLLLAEGQGRPHALVAGHAADAADADFAVVAVSRDPGRVIVTGAAGPLAAGLVNQTGPLAGSLAGQVISSGKPGLVAGDRLEAAAALLGAGIGPLIAVPLAAGERVFGVLAVGRLAARPGLHGLEGHGRPWSFPC